MSESDKWLFTPEQRTFPCSICNKPKYCFNSELTEDCKPVKPVICIDCYIPENPTRGWMLTQAKKIKTFDFEHYKTLSEAQQETYLRKLLKIQAKDDSELGYNKDDR